MVRFNLSTALLAATLALGAGGVMYSYLHADEAEGTAQPARPQSDASAIAASRATGAVPATAPAVRPSGKLPPIDAQAHPQLETATFAFG